LAVETALNEWTVASPIKRWIKVMLSKLILLAKLGSITTWVKPHCGLPQAAGLSTTLWSLVADSLLQWLSKQGVLAQGFADDGVILLIGIFLATLCEIAQIILHVSSLGVGSEISVNPTKTEMILFTRRYKPEGLLPIVFYGKELQFANAQQVKYLGVWLDSTLRWKTHVDLKCKKAISAIYQVKRAVGKT
jgi:hypothetical protein